MSEYPQIETLMRNHLERERVSLTCDVDRATMLKEELADVMLTCNAKRERIAEMERWLKNFSRPD